MRILPKSEEKNGAFQKYLNLESEKNKSHEDNLSVTKAFRKLQNSIYSNAQKSGRNN